MHCCSIMNRLPLKNVSKCIFLQSRKICSSSRNSIVIEKLDHITTIGINRPSKRNCFNLQTVDLMRKALEDFEHDDTAYVAVLHGMGGNFCSGFDLNELVNLENETEFANMLDTGLMGLPSYISKPMVAGISGYAVAGGLELALLCDLRVVEDTAIMGLYGRRFGVPLTDGATVRLQAVIGLSRTLDMVLTGRSLNAEEAFQWGLANKLVACGTALGQAINLAGSLVKFPQKTLKIDRDSTYNSAFNQVYLELLQEERKRSKSSLLTDAVEGAKKFFLGLGKHGKFYNLTDKEVKEWENEYRTPKSKQKSRL